MRLSIPKHITFTSIVDAVYKLFLATNSFFFVSLLLFQWIKLVELGGVSLKHTHIFVGLMGGCLVFKRFRSSMFFFLKKFHVFLLIYGILFTTYIVSATYTEHLKQAVVFLFKAGVNFGLFLLLAVNFIEVIRLKLTKALLYGALFGTLLFVAYTQLAFFVIGQSFIEVIGIGLLSGDPQVLMFQLYKRLFNFDIWAMKVNYDSDDEVVVALRNNLATGFLFFFFLFSIFGKKKTFFSTWRRSSSSFSCSLRSAVPTF